MKDERKVKVKKRRVPPLSNREGEGRVSSKGGEGDNSEGGTIRVGKD